MTDINTAYLLNQMSAFSRQAEGGMVQSSSQSNESFGSVFHAALNTVNEMSQTSDHLKTRFELGDPNVSVGEVMVAGQKASLGFEATVRVRNKLVQAYQDIMNMPI